MHPKELSIEDFTYELSPERIAHFPLSNRDQSKLLIYKEHQISEDRFINLGNFLPGNNGLIIFNDTKVIPARILFTKPTGGSIEIFCLEPFGSDHTSAMQATSVISWKCLIRGIGKWRTGALIKSVSFDNDLILLRATLIEKIGDSYIVKFSWDNSSYIFTQVLQAAGEIPLPPYIKRKAILHDKETYQTIYANEEGSVAAPTAGLHFTQELMASLKNRGLSIEYITLHVGAGTFKPVKSDNMAGHAMHAEYMDVSIITIQNIIAHLGNITCVGTTSLRVIESIFWMGTKCYLEPLITSEKLMINQWEVYEDPLRDCPISPKDALSSLLAWMNTNDLLKLVISTSILIAPSYRFRLINALITNFHQPGSTLLLLVAAITGEHWRQIYQHALNNDYRFLSYGDGCLLFIS